MRHSFLIHSSADGHLGSSLIACGAVRNSLYPRNRASAGTSIPSQGCVAVREDCLHICFITPQALATC